MVIIAQFCEYTKTTELRTFNSEFVMCESLFSKHDKYFISKSQRARMVFKLSRILKGQSFGRGLVEKNRIWKSI